MPLVLVVSLPVLSTDQRLVLTLQASLGTEAKPLHKSSDAEIPPAIPCRVAMVSSASLYSSTLKAHRWPAKLQKLKSNGRRSWMYLVSHQPVQKLGQVMQAAPLVRQFASP